MKCPSMSMCAALLLCAPGVSYADPPLSVLQSVEVITRDGSVHGYAVWTTDKLYWLNVRKAEERRGADFVDEPPSREEVRAFLLEENLLVYPDAVRLKGVVLATAAPRAIKKGEIVDLALRTSRLNGFRWLGPVVVSKRRPRT